MTPRTWLHVRHIPAGEPLNAPEHPAHLREGPVDHDRWLCRSAEHGWYLLKHDPRTPSELRREDRESPEAHSRAMAPTVRAGTD